MTYLPSQPRLSVCITTRNRPNDLIRCLNSLTLIKDISFEIIVIDDASDPAIDQRILSSLDSTLSDKTRIVRHVHNKGCVASRNDLAKQAKAPYLLYLDDDAQLLSGHSINTALQVLENDASIGAVALSQSYEDGSLLPDQPAPVAYNCYTPSYIGYGHILRRELFLKLGGYRETFWAYYEEAEYCKRMLDRGFYVVYLPQASVIHYHSAIGRNELTSLRNGCRNKCFAALYNEPIAMLIFSIPLRLIGYLFRRKKFCQQHNISDPEGMKWLINELTSKFPQIWQERKALKWSTYYKWHKIKTEKAAYQLAD